MRQPDWLVSQLPVGMLESGLFVRFVQLFQEVADSVLDGVDSAEHVLDPTVAPAPVLPFLASWIGVNGLDPGTPVARQREVLQTSSRGLAWRGTRSGVAETARLLSGGVARVTDNGGVFSEGPVRSAEGTGWVPPEEPDDVAPWVRVEVPSTGGMGLSEYVGLLLEEVPAHVALELVVAGETVWSTGPTVAAPPVRQGAAPLVGARADGGAT